MTRQEFINGYFSARRPHNAYLTGSGYTQRGREYEAIPCTCGQVGCDGWRMSEVLPRNSPEKTATGVNENGISGQQ